MADSFFYAVLNENNDVIAHASFENLKYSVADKLQPILNDTILKENFASINICSLSNNGILSGKRDDSIVNMFPSMESKSIYFEKLDGNDIFHYFGVSQHQERFLDNLTEGRQSRLRSLASIFAHWFCTYSNPFIHIHFEENYMIIYVQNEGKVSFFNTFPYDSANDILYFALAVCQSTGISAMDNCLSLSGWIESDSKVFRTLTAYFRHVKFNADCMPVYETDKIKSKKSQFYFLHLLNSL
jgi:hypothetical protein